MRANTEVVLAQEREYHEKLYSGFAQNHFAKPAVRALRRHMVKRILAKTGAGPQSRVLSIGCGIGDTEILLAPHVREVIGIDISPAAVRQANEDAGRSGAVNFRAREATLESFRDGRFDVVMAIFFLHHLPDKRLADCASRVHAMLRPGGVFYSLDPSRYRLSGFVGNLLFRSLMAKHQTPNERPLCPETTRSLFASPRLATQASYYDFVSTPLAGLLPSWRAGYLAARVADEILIRTPWLRLLSSNFELTAVANRDAPKRLA